MSKGWERLPKQVPSDSPRDLKDVWGTAEAKGWAEPGALGAGEIGKGLCYGLTCVSLFSLYVEALTPRASGCDCIWTQ